MSDYALAIDRDNDGDLSNAEFINENLSFDGRSIVFEDVDFLDGNYFTLITDRDDDISVSIEQEASQLDPTNVDNARFRVSFDTQIDPSTFTVDDINIVGTTGTVTS